MHGAKRVMLVQTAAEALARLGRPHPACLACGKQLRPRTDYVVLPIAGFDPLREVVPEAGTPLMEFGISRPERAYVTDWLAPLSVWHRRAYDGSVYLLHVLLPGFVADGFFTREGRLMAVFCGPGCAAMLGREAARAGYRLTRAGG